MHALARIEKSIVTNAPPEKVFALLADAERAAEWMDTVKEVKVTSEKRTGVGKTWHMVTEAGARARTENFILYSDYFDMAIKMGMGKGSKKKPKTKKERAEKRKKRKEKRSKR